MSRIPEKVQLSRDEFRNITRCLENEEFRKLFVEYCEELKNPVNRKQFEDEIKLLEAERGYDVQFIKPLPGYVIKTVVDGKIKAFINICHCDLIDKPVSQFSTNKNGQNGLEWSIPYAQSHPRKDYDNKKAECIVYDVIFHYDTLHLTSKNANLRMLVTSTALDAVEKSFQVSLDRNNLRFPKLQYKGAPKMTVIRKKETNCMDSQIESLINKHCPGEMQKVAIDYRTENEKNEENQMLDETVKADYINPSYKLIHRKDIEYYELTEEPDAKACATVPSELEIVVELPLLKSAAECILNVTKKELHLISENMAKYKLLVKLPYEVDEKEGSAKFNPDNKTLTVTLPVVKKHLAIPNSKECVNQTESNATTDSDSGFTEKSIEPTLEEVFKDSPKCDSKKIFPKFSANKMDNIVAFTLCVRNIDPESIELEKRSDTVVCNFSNIGSGFFPCHYLFCARFPNVSIAEVHHEQWDNNLILQIVLSSSQIDCYYAGKDVHNLAQHFIMEGITDKFNKFGKEIEDDSLCIAVSKNVSGQEKNLSHLSIEIKTKDKNGADVCDTVNNDIKTCVAFQDKNDTEFNARSMNSTTNMNVIERNQINSRQNNCHETKKSKKNSRGKNKRRSLSESCCDQLKVIGENEICKYESTDLEPLNDIINHQANEVCTPRKARSISESSSPTFGSSADQENLNELMQLNHKCKGILKRSSFERSISECSSFDDSIFQASSVDVSSIAGSIDQSHGELSESCRKTVRFNDSIKTKLFRSNTSILSQKKKNAKKNESKRRSLTRRSSEGESTDTEDKEAREFDETQNLEVQRDHDHDSGISLDSDAGIIAVNNYNVLISKKLKHDAKTPNNNISENKQRKNNCKTSITNQKPIKSSKPIETEFRSDMIFDIEM